jgi:hypothetical protein
MPGAAWLLSPRNRQRTPPGAPLSVVSSIVHVGAGHFIKPRSDESPQAVLGYQNSAADSEAQQLPLSYKPADGPRTATQKLANLARS